MEDVHGSLYELRRNGRNAKSRTASTTASYVVGDRGRTLLVPPVFAFKPSPRSSRKGRSELHKSATSPRPKRLSRQAGVGFDKRRTESRKENKSKSFRLFGFSTSRVFLCFFALFGACRVFRLFDFACAFRTFSVLSGQFSASRILDSSAFSHFPVRFRVTWLFAFFWAFGKLGPCRLRRFFPVFTQQPCSLGCCSRRKHSGKPRRPRGWGLGFRV